jgi:hypothetical protein
VIYILAVPSAEEFSRLSAVADFAAQMSLPLAVLSEASLLDGRAPSEFLRLVAAHVEGRVTRHFVIGQVEFGQRDGELAARLADMLETGWFGRFHVSADPAQVLTIDRVSRKDAPGYLHTTTGLDRARF